MIRPSFLLLLMAAAACCAPTSLEGPQSSQPNECPQLFNITHTKLDAKFPGAVCLPAEIKMDNVVCKRDIQRIAYESPYDGISIARIIKCQNGELWAADPRTEFVETAKVCCISSSFVPTTPKPTHCTDLGEIHPAHFNKPEFMPDLFKKELTTPNYYTNGTIACITREQSLYVQTEDDGVFTAEKLTCDNAEWILKRFGESPRKFKPTNVICVKTVFKKP